MDGFTIREMRIAGIAIAATVIALSFAQSGGHGAFDLIRVLLAVLALGLVVWAGRLRPQEQT
jgi:hypothetical protein